MFLGASQDLGSCRSDGSCNRRLFLFFREKESLYSGFIVIQIEARLTPTLTFSTVKIAECDSINRTAGETTTHLGRVSCLQEHEDTTSL